MSRRITIVTTGLMLTGLIAGAAGVSTLAVESTTKDTAIGIALADAGLSEENVTIDEVEKGNEQGASVYEIEFWTQEKDYEYDIALADGEIVSSGWYLVEPALEGKEINQARAKKIAFEYAGVAESKATSMKAKNGTENGIPVFEIKFEDGAAEYEFDIAKQGGEILNYSKTVKTPASSAAAAAGGKSALAK